MRPNSLLLAGAASLLASSGGSTLVAEQMPFSTYPDPVDFTWEPDDFYEERKVEQYRNLTPKQSRNSRCNCGSGLKHKRCCGREL